MTGVSDICGASASAAGTAALCSSRAPLGRGEQAEEKSRVARSRAGCARVRCQYRDVLSADPVACSRSRRGMDAPATAAARVSFSLVTFFWTSKRKSPADRDVRRTTHGREAVIAKTPERHASLALTLPSPASGRGENGIARRLQKQKTRPAFAGRAHPSILAL